MNNNIQISCNIDTTNPMANLGLEIRLDKTTIFELNHVTGPIKFTHDLSDNDAEHLLEFVLKGKTSADTTIDANGDIISDARLIISDLAFDGIELKQSFIDLSTYTHDFNGTKETVNTKFYGEMGCNGVVSFSFNSPVFLWLLEVM